MRLPLALAALLGACSTSYSGSARTATPATVQSDTGWVRVDDVPLVKQRRETDCGAAAIAMVVAYWTGASPPDLIAGVGRASKRGIKAGRLRDFARKHGLAAFLVQGELADLEHELRQGRPVLVGLAKPQRK